MGKLSTDERVGWMQLRVAERVALMQLRVSEKERRQRGGGMTVRVEDMRYLLDRMVALERERDSEVTKAEDWFRRHNDVEADLKASRGGGVCAGCGGMGCRDCGGNGTGEG